MGSYVWRHSRRTRRARNMSRVWGRHSPTSTTKSWDAISICEIVATGRYLLSAFSVSFENPNEKTKSGLKAGSANANRDVSCLCGRRSSRIKFLPLFCSGVVRLARIWAGSWRCIQSGRLMQFSRYITRIANRLPGCKSI